MSLNDYEKSKEIALRDWSFYALIMAAMRQADSLNLERLKGCFPGAFQELQERYGAPGGLLPEERFTRGVQITYIPTHAGADYLHKDAEDGFVTSTRRNSEGKCVIFCRYWNKFEPSELRTRANSEATPMNRLVERDTRPQEEVDKWLKIIGKEEMGDEVAK